MSEAARRFRRRLQMAHPRGHSAARALEADVAKGGPKSCLAFHKSQGAPQEPSETGKSTVIEVGAELDWQLQQIAAELGRLETSEACTVVVCRLRAVC